MSFFKKNSYDIVKLYINQIGIAIFSTILYTAIGGLDSGNVVSGLNIGISIFAAAFYFVLLYTVSWEYGAKDKSGVDSSKLSLDKFKGVKLGLFAAIPNFVFSVIALVCTIIYRTTLSTVAGSILAITNFVIRMTMSMYLGIINEIFGSFLATDLPMATPAFLYQTIAFAFTPLLAVAVIHVGYLLGLKNIRIFGSLSSKSGKHS